MIWRSVLLGSALLLGGQWCGCQTPGVVVSEEASPVCPTCKDETRTSPIRGVTYEKHVCPTCEEVQIYDDVREKPHVYCANCEAVIEECPQCRGE